MFYDNNAMNYLLISILLKDLFKESEQNSEYRY